LIRGSDQLGHPRAKSDQQPGFESSLQNPSHAKGRGKHAAALSNQLCRV